MEIEKIGSTGRAIMHVEVDIRDDDGNSLLPARWRDWLRGPKIAAPGATTRPRPPFIRRGSAAAMSDISTKTVCSPTARRPDHLRREHRVLRGRTRCLSDGGRPGGRHHRPAGHRMGERSPPSGANRARRSTTPPSTPTAAPICRFPRLKELHIVEELRATRRARC